MIKAIELMKSYSAVEIGGFLDKSRITGWRIKKGDCNLTQEEINTLCQNVKGLKHKDFF